MMNITKTTSTIHNALAATLVTVAACLTLASCERSHRVGAAQSTILQPKIEGFWTSPQGQDLAITRHADTGDYQGLLNLAMPNGSVEQRMYPIRLLRVNSTTIGELQLVRQDDQGRTIAGFLYGKIDFEGDALVFAPLSKGWLQGFASGAQQRMTTVELSLPGNTTGVLARSDAGGMGAMLDAAARDASAWSPGEVYSRKK